MKLFKLIELSDNEFMLIYRSKCGHYYIQIKTFTDKATTVSSFKHRVTLRWLYKNYLEYFI